MTLGSIANLKTGPFGTQFSASEYSATGTPILNVKSIGHGVVLRDDLDYVPDSVRDRLAAHTLVEGDIVFARKGSVDRHAYVSANEAGWIQGSDCIRVQCKHGVNSRFISHWLKLDAVKEQVNNSAVGSTMASLNTDILAGIHVRLPDPETQNAVAAFLSRVEDQVALNTQINDNLQAILQTLYGYWFLQFDFPDENGRPYRSSGGRMVWNDQLKREIPAGWLVVSITDHADVYQPKTISSRLFDDSHPFPVYGGGGYIGRFNQFNHQESEVIISCRGDCGRVYLTMPESWVTGNAMVVHPRGDCLPKEYLYLLLKNSNLEHYVTGSVQKQLTRQNFELLPILVPSRDVLERFTSFTKITISRQLEIVRENRKLQELRDWLLPMLMNGQATVANSDKLSFT